MVNQHRGEVELVAGSATYTLRMSINEIVELEQLLDKGVAEISVMLADGANIRVGAWRAALWAALQAHHRGITLDQAGEIIAEARLPVVMEKVGAALQAAFPQGVGTQNPRVAGPKAGTGKR